MNRLTGVSYPGGENISYSYDAMGNRTRMTTAQGTTSYSYNQLNQLVSAGSINYEYDAEGKLIKKTAGSETFDYQYNAYDRLSQVTKNNTEIASYAYDPMGRRVSVTEDGRQRDYLWNGDSLLATYVSGTMENLYAVGSGIDEVLGVYGNQTQYLHSNHLGSIVGITGTDGSVLGTRSYTPFGVVRNTTGNFNTNLGFIGRSQSNTTGLTYIRARYYDANVGRFTRVDPIRDGLNWYGYTGGNPVKYVDPYGLWFGADDTITGPVDEIIVIGGLYLAATYGNSEWAQNTMNNLIGVVQDSCGRLFVKSETPEEGNDGECVDDLLEGAEPGRETKGKTEQWEKPGGLEQAEEDFDSLELDGVRDIPVGKLGTLPDGRRVNVRNKSSDGRPTLEIYNPNNGRKIKIRYY
ncbi:RHS repeat domain-containing protein [Orenia marismortui]|uniref:RHS repeat-associated protein n=1 Tax=Orenia marismortui TaxID=46469 RepID=A0A4R8H3H5_9FIRM|nr:RHS repeat-associated core domain-containing protein [Orenia marismortui]TDX51134.1 RHS repeat-associated protein [Orenia marismortui]